MILRDLLDDVKFFFIKLFGKNKITDIKKVYQPKPIDIPTMPIIPRYKTPKSKKKEGNPLREKRRERKKRKRRNKRRQKELSDHNRKLRHYEKEHDKYEKRKAKGN